MLKPRRWTWGRCTPLSTSLCNVATLNNLSLLFHTACFLAGVSGREAELSLLGSGSPGSGLDYSGYVSSECIFKKILLHVD